MPDPPAPGSPDLDTTAVWTGAAAWFEDRMFEVIGAWVAATPEPEVQVALAAHAHHHAWHAELLRDLVPVRADLPAEPYLVPTPAAVALVDVVGTLGGRDVTVERLAVLARVILPRLRAAWADRLEVASAAADGPLVRALTLVTRDDRDDQLITERLLQGLLVSASEVDRAAEAVASAERAVVVAGGTLP